MALDACLREILQNLQEDIVLTVNLACLLPFLRQKQLVTTKQEQELSSDRRETESERNEKLIRIIMGKGVNAFDLFVEALKEEKEHLGHGSLADKLLQEQSRLKPAESEKSRPPEPLPRNRKPATSGPSAPATLPKPTAKPKQDFNAVKYTLSVQGHDELPQNYRGLIATDEKLMNQMNVRLSAVERDVKTIKDAVNNVSLEEKLGRAIENIENKVDKLTNFVYSQSEQACYTEARANSSVLVPTRLQDQDEMYIYAAIASSNEYVDSKEQFYDTVADTSVKKAEHPGSRCEYDYATTRHGPVPRYMPLSNTNRDCSAASYHSIRTIKQPRIQQSSRPSFAVMHQQLKELYSKNPMNEGSSSGSECEDL